MEDGVKNIREGGKKREWQSLLALFLLGCIGGVLYDAGDVVLRLWSRSMGFGPRDLDILNTIEMVHPLKFLWAPILSLPLFMGPWRERRAWLLMAMVVATLSMVMLCVTPFFGLYFLIFLLILTLARASYDALVIASQMDAVSKNLWGFSENSCVMGYRLGIMATSYFALGANTAGLSWEKIYGYLAGFMLLSLMLLAYGPMFRFLNGVQSTAKEVGSQKSQRVWSSLREWMHLWGSGWVLLFLLIYRLQDGLIDPQREYFLLDSGLSNMGLAHLKSLGLGGCLAGGLGAGACIRYGGYRSALSWGLVLHGLAGGLLYVASGLPCPSLFLKMAYVLEQSTKGWSTIAIYSFQLVCCHGGNTIGQIALFSALSDMGLKIMSMRSGWLAQTYGWGTLMGTGALCGLPALCLLPHIFSKTFIADKIRERTAITGEK